MSQNPQPKKKPEPKNSETDTSETVDESQGLPENSLVDEAVEEILQKIDEALEGLVGRPADPEAVHKLIMAQIKGLLDDEEDAALVYDVKLVTRDRIAVSVKGAAKLSGLFDASAVAEAPEVFQSIFYNSVWQPMRVKLYKKLQESVKTAKALPAITGGMEDDDGLPQIPLPGVSSDRLPMGE